MADVVAIQLVRGTLADCAMRDDYDDGFVTLLTSDASWSIPDMGVSFRGTSKIHAGIERMKGLWSFFVQTVHPGAIKVAADGRQAVGRAYVSEIGRFHDGGSRLSYARDDGVYARTPQGWRFASRTYAFLYVDTRNLPASSLACA